MHTINRTLAVISSIAVLASAGGAHGKGGSDAASESICFLAADAEHLVQLEGVTVSAITQEGSAPLGVTGRDGALCLAKGDIAALAPYVILFCRESFFCGALEVREDHFGHQFLDFNEHFIALARFTISN